MTSRTRPKLLYLVTEDWYFLSHRLPMARAARAAGFDVTVATRVNDVADARRIEMEGFRVAPLDWRRGGRNPLAELGAVLRIGALYRRARPDIVHHVAMKPVLEGGVAARLAGVPHVVNALTGLGHLFIGTGGPARILRPFVRLALRWLLGHRGSILVMQNPDDLEALVARGIARRDRAVLIAGSGVDSDALRPMPEPPGPPVAAFVGRMLWDKGVGELVEAARLLRGRGTGPRLRLIGPTDAENPAGIPEATLRQWTQEGAVEWTGAVRDIAQVWRECAIAVLPSYREGLPKALLEAASCGRPMVATDVPGCREIVRHEETGLLVPPRDPAALADALARLAGDPGLRARLGAGARALVERRFGADRVAAATVALYRALLEGRAMP